MWTPDRDAELRRLGVETYISRHPGADVHEVLDRYLLLVDPVGRAALLRERNRGIEEGRWTQPIMAKAKTPLPAPWPPEAVDRLRELCDRRLANADIAQIMGKTEKSVAGKRRRLGLRPQPPSSSRPQQCTKSGTRDGQTRTLPHLQSFMRKASQISR